MPAYQTDSQTFPPSILDTSAAVDDSILRQQRTAVAQSQKICTLHGSGVGYLGPEASH